MPFTLPISAPAAYVRAYWKDVLMVEPNRFIDPTLAETLRETGAPRILTARADGTPVYVALDDAGELIEVTP